MTWILCRALGPALVAIIGLTPPAYADEVFTYRGMCEASAAVPLGPDFFAAATDERNKLQIYRRGEPAPVEATTINLNGLNPEALFAIPNTDKVQVLSDDGGITTAGVKCKDLRSELVQSFRSVILTP